MLFGNRERLALEIQPLSPTWERRYAPEFTAWAALSVWVGGRNLCRHSESGSDLLHDALNVPLAPIADWLVRSWPYIAFEERAALFAVRGGLHDTHARWGAAPPSAGVSEDAWYDRREEWWQRHFLAAGAEGALLPGLALAREDERLVLEWHHARHAELTLLEAEGSCAVAWAEARDDVVGNFVAHVAEWLRRDGLSGIYPWVSTSAPLHARSLPWSERLELYTGRPRAEIAALMGARDDDDLARQLGLPPQSDDPAGSPVTQALRDLPPGLPAEAGHVLVELEQSTRRAAAAPALDRSRGVALDASRDAASPEESGYASARALRAELGLDGHPVQDVREFLGFLGVDLAISTQRAPGTRMLMGRRDGARGVAIVLESQRTRVKWGQRFEAARALGHALLDPLRQGVVGAASSAFAQDVRRRRSGAFAAELLLPESALQRESDGALDRGADPEVFERLMNLYGVGARTAAQQLYNHQLLSSAEIRDQLIDDYGAPAST